MTDCAPIVGTNRNGSLVRRSYGSCAVLCPTTGNCRSHMSLCAYV